MLGEVDVCGSIQLRQGAIAVYGTADTVDPSGIIVEWILKVDVGPANGRICYAEKNGWPLLP
jgi:hypothetical protein